MRGYSLRWRADVDVRAGGRSGNRSANGDERDALRGEITDQRLPFGAVRMQGDVDRVAVIEAQPVVRFGLADRACGKGFAEFQSEERVHLSEIAERPARRANVADQQSGGTINSGFFRGHFGELFRRVDLGHQLINLANLLHRFGDLALSFGQLTLALFKLAFGYHAESEQFLALSDQLGRARLILSLQLEQLLQTLPVRVRRAEQICARFTRGFGQLLRPLLGNLWGCIWRFGFRRRGPPAATLLRRGVWRGDDQNKCQSGQSDAASNQSTAETRRTLRKRRERGRERSSSSPLRFLSVLRVSAVD